MPFEGWDRSTAQLAQAYADLLLSMNSFGHDLPSGDPTVDSPFLRVQSDPLLGPCTELLGRAENLAAFFTSDTLFLPK